MDFLYMGCHGSHESKPSLVVRFKLTKLEILQISITSSKNLFGTQPKAHIVANRAARHLHLKKLEKEQKKKEKVVRGIFTSTVP